MPDYNHDLVKAEILANMMGKISQEDLVQVHPSLSDQNQTARNQFWDYLIKSCIIDSTGKLLTKTIISDESFANLENQDIKLRAVNFF